MEGLGRNLNQALKVKYTRYAFYFIRPLLSGQEEKYEKTKKKERSNLRRLWM